MLVQQLVRAVQKAQSLLASSVACLMVQTAALSWASWMGASVHSPAMELVEEEAVLPCHVPELDMEQETS